ncbi:MAG: cell wall-binding repeat-containing protein [Solirubrobacterales bacterium]
MPKARCTVWLCALAALLSPIVLAACGSDRAPVTIAESGQQEAGAQGSKPAVVAALPVTRNTSRIDGSTAEADAAEVALATHPRFEGAKPIEAAVIVPAQDWQAGVAASVLAGDPLRAPILLSQPGSVPDETAAALEALQPQGGSGPADAAAYRVGDAAVPDGLATSDIGGDTPAARAAKIDQLRGRLTGAEPASVLVVSDAEPGFAMPAAAWAARSGDPVLFVGQDDVPPETSAALDRHKASSVYLLGPESVASAKVLRELQRSSPGVKRISGDDPIANAIVFAQFSDAGFGWGITDPGHGIVIANSDRPSDAGAAAALSASGTYGPLLLTDSATTLPEPLREFLLSIKPGYSEDPTRALYNRVWLIGEGRALSGALQGQIDEITELARIGVAGAPATAVLPGQGAKEQEPVTPPGGKKVK